VFPWRARNLAGLAWTTKAIKLTINGTPWRPLVHGLDIARAIIAVLQAPSEAIHNEVFNVGDTSHNYRVREIADVVGEVFPGCRVSFGAPGQDNRSYRVSFEKIRNICPGSDVAGTCDGGRNNFTIFSRRIDMTKAVFEYRTFTRLKQLEYFDTDEAD
jgi:nucleoside-diphosphate-sugar epimerase